MPININMKKRMLLVKELDENKLNKCFFFRNHKRTPPVVNFYLVEELFLNPKKLNGVFGFSVRKVVQK